jgi:phosphocarrier protein
MQTPGSQPVTEGPDPVVRARLTMGYDRGMHARPALLLAQRAREFQADIALVLVSCPVDISTPAGTRADAKSMLDLMFLQAPCGSELDVEAVGPDAEAAVEAIEGLFRDRFGIRD